MTQLSVPHRPTSDIQPPPNTTTTTKMPTPHPPNPTTLAKLPDEILQSILSHLDAKTILSLGSTSRRFTALSQEASQWRRFCLTSFKYWESRADFQRLLRDGTFREWKKVYRDRVASATTTRSLLRAITGSSQGRAEKLEAVVAQGYGAKDALVQMYAEAAGSLDHLDQRYWSHVALGCLHRSMALKIWTDIRYGKKWECMTEMSLAAFDLFVLDQHERGDVDDVFERLDYYVSETRGAYPDLDEQTPRTKAMTIAAYLRERHWIGIDQGREYHSLDNMFLGVALFSPHKNSLPLITCVIYSYVARQFDLRAQPISYPMHVHVLVQPPVGFDLDGNTLQLQPDSDDRPSTKTHLYMDPFNNIEPVALSTLQSQLRFIVPRADVFQSNMYLSPATYRDLVIRTAHNILNTRTIDPRPLAHPIAPEAATYAAFFALVLFPTHPASLRTHFTELTQHFLHHYDHDIHNFRTYIMPLTQNLPDHLAYRNLAHQLQRNDNESLVPKIRNQTPDENPVRYRIGQLFRHRRRNYHALIYGWDSTCEMNQQWISMNQVDRLPRGRNQPFYNVLVIDDRSTRYVAEENVVLLGPPEEGGNGEMVSLDEVLRWPIEIGKWMKKFDADERGMGYRFVSNVRDQYPED